MLKIFLQKIGLFNIIKEQIHKRDIQAAEKNRNESFRSDFNKFVKLSQNAQSRFPLNWENRMPCLDDKTTFTSFDRHYIYHPAWAARVLSKINPKLHIDISSILNFSTIVSAFVPVKFYDYRPVSLDLSNLTSESADLTNLPFESNSVESISCMHTVEHIGLGRYGDPLDYDGDLKAINELKRVIAPGGHLLFVVPVGKPVILFNGHRIYSYRQVIECFPEFELRDFSLVPDDPKEGGLINSATEKKSDQQRYGCGCFWFQKNNFAR